MGLWWGEVGGEGEGRGDREGWGEERLGEDSMEGRESCPESTTNDIKHLK